jgi:hypothetical protein
MPVCFYKFYRKFKYILHVFKEDKNYKLSNTILNLAAVICELVFYCDVWCMNKKWYRKCDVHSTLRLHFLGGFINIGYPTMNIVDVAYFEVRYNLQTENGT